MMFGKPNIIGEIKMHAISNAGLLYADVADQGAFYKSGSTNIVPTGGPSAGAHLGFDASKSDAVFGASKKSRRNPLYSYRGGMRL